MTTVATTDAMTGQMPPRTGMGAGGVPASTLVKIMGGEPPPASGGIPTQSMHAQCMSASAHVFAPG